MKKTIALISVVFLMAWAGYMVADTTFSWSGAQQSGTLTYVNLGLTTPTITGGITGDVASSGKVSSYGYPAVVGHTNGSAQVYMTQSGTVIGAVATSGVSYAVSYIATPQVVCMPTVGAVVTNGATITASASNYFVVTTGEATNFYWIAHGRIK